MGTVQLFETAHNAYPNFELPIDYPFIRLLGVDPAWRGHGIARELLRQCVASAKDMGKNTVYLFTGGQMTNAIRLYERFGFVEDEEFSTRSSGATPSVIVTIHDQCFMREHMELSASYKTSVHLK